MISLAQISDGIVFALSYMQDIFEKPFKAAFRAALFLQADFFANISRDGIFIYDDGYCSYLKIIILHK